MEQLYHCKGVGELGLLILSNTNKSGQVWSVYFVKYVVLSSFGGSFVGFVYVVDKLICKAPVVFVIIRLVFVYP